MEINDDKLEWICPNCGAVIPLKRLQDYKIASHWNRLCKKCKKQKQSKKIRRHRWAQRSGHGKNKRERGHAPKRKRRLRVPHHSYKRIPYRRRYEGDCRFDNRREKVFYAKIQGQRRVHCARIFSRRKGRSGKIQDAV